MTLKKPRAMRAAIGSLVVRLGCVLGVIATLGSSWPAAAATQEPPETQEPPVSAPPPTNDGLTPQAPSQSPKAEPERAEGANRVIKDHAFLFPSYVGSSIIAS